jgi:hypothetical protein
LLDLILLIGLLKVNMTFLGILVRPNSSYLLIKRQR